MNRVGSLIVMMLVSCGGVCSAQTTADKGDLPPKPWVHTKMSDFACWKIDFRYADATSKPKPGPRPLRLQTVLVTKTHNIKQQQNVYENGLTSEQWVDRTTVMKSQPGSSKITVDLFRTGTSEDLPEFGWLTRTNYIGKKQVDGQNCLLFQEQMPALKFNDPDTYSLLLSSDPKSELLHEMATIIAAVNPATMLPVSLQVNADARFYTFLPPATETLAIPPQFAAVEAESQARFRERNKPLPTP